LHFAREQTLSKKEERKMANKPSQQNKPEAATPEAPKPKAAPKPPPEMPKIDSLEGQAKVQFTAVVEAAKAYMEAYKAAVAVPVGFLRDTRRAITAAQTGDLKNRVVDPKTKKRERLLKAIEKAKAQLEELGA
jgi:hypothetical protein